MPHLASSSSLVLGAVVGIATGCIGVLLVVVYIVHRRKQHHRKPFSVSSCSSVTAGHMLAGVSNTDSSSKKHPFLSLGALEIGELDTEYPMTAVDLQQKQQQPHQLLLSSGIDKNMTPAYHEHQYTAPAANVGAHLKSDETIYRPRDHIEAYSWLAGHHGHSRVSGLRKFCKRPTKRATLTHPNVLYHAHSSLPPAHPNVSSLRFA